LLSLLIQPSEAAFWVSVLGVGIFTPSFFYLLLFAFYLIMPKPNKNVHIMKLAATYAVNLFSPVSALFWDENIWLAPPIPAIPSPFGE
jgi:hypothetical protein